MSYGYKKLSSEEIAEGTMIVEISEYNFYRLPNEAQQLLHYFLIQAGGTSLVMKFDLPVYRWRQVQEMLKRIEA